MAYKGSRTKTTAIWLAPEDEVRVGPRNRGCGTRAAWLCSPPGRPDYTRFTCTEISSRHSSVGPFRRFC